MFDVTSCDERVDAVLGEWKISLSLILLNGLNMLALIERVHENDLGLGRKCDGKCCL